jgi:hypothetical protein
VTVAALSLLLCLAPALQDQPLKKVEPESPAPAAKAPAPQPPPQPVPPTIAPADRPAPAVAAQPQITKLGTVQGQGGFTTGQTTKTGKNVNRITGALLPPNLQAQFTVRAMATARLQNLIKAQAAAALPAEHDSRKNADFAVQHQSDFCGSCWIFAALAAYEHSHARLKLAGVADPSEGDVLAQLSRSGRNCCDGGWPSEVFDHMRQSRVARRTDVPYNINNPTVKLGLDRPYLVAEWAPVVERVGVPETELIKSAILQYGAVAVGVAVGDQFQNYTGGVFNTHLSSVTFNGHTQPINHAVAIVGWKDTPGTGSEGHWIVRNSWGADWGERGYIRIAYKASNIGYGAMWVVPRIFGDQTPPTPPNNPSEDPVAPSDIAKRLKDRREAWVKLYPDVQVIDD